MKTKNWLVTWQSFWRISAGAALVCLGLPAGAQDDQADDEQLEEVEGFVVTGSLIRRTDLEGPAPVQTIDAEEIEVRGFQQVSDLLRNLPQNSGLTEADATASFAADGSYVNLRGIGPQGTLLLVNGRRLAPYGASDFQGRSFVDLNSIPVSAIERVDVLKTGASAIYGSDALGGAINIILKKDFEGLEFNAYYGNTTSEEDFSTYSLTATIGVSSEKGSLIVIANYMNRQPLFMRERDYLAESNFYGVFDDTASLDVDGYYDFTKATGGQEWGGYMFRSSATNMGRYGDLDDTLGLAGVTYYGGYLFAGDGSEADQKAWEYYNYNEEITAISGATRRGLIIMGDYQVTDTINYFLEANYQKNHAETTFAPAPSFGDFTVSADNPYNPTNPNNTAYYEPAIYTRVGADPAGYPNGIDLSIPGWRPKDGGNRDFETDSGFYRLVTGFEMELPDIDWNVDLAFSYVESEVVDVTRNLLVLDFVQQYLDNTETSATSAVPSTWALNPFSNDYNEGDNDTIFNDLITTDDTRFINSSLQMLELRAGGPLFDLPGGALQLAVGAEGRRESLEDRPSFASSQGQLIGSGGTSSKGDREAWAVYSELQIPIIEQIEVQIAARYEDYDDFGDTGVKPQAGVIYRPLEWFAIRGAWSDNFKAPSLAQAYAGLQRGFTNINDPIRFPITDDPVDGTGTQKETRTGGNPTLQPEESQSTSIGLVFSGMGPIEGLEVNIDFWQIDASSLISTESENQILAAEADAFAADPAGFLAMSPSARLDMFHVSRDPNENFFGQEIPGRILYIDSTYQNLDSLVVQGIDLDVSYVFPTEDWGSFTVQTVWTYFDRYEENNDGFNEVGTFRLPEFRGNASVSWDYEDYRVAMIGYYISAYEDSEWDYVEDWTTYDLRFTYRGLYDTEITVGLDNVFGENPPWWRGDSAGYDPAFHDPIGRYAWIAIKRVF